MTTPWCSQKWSCNAGCLLIRRCIIFSDMMFFVWSCNMSLWDHAGRLTMQWSVNASFSVTQGSHRFCLVQFQHFSKPFAKPNSHPRTDLTGQNKTKNSHSQPTRLHKYCTVCAVWQWVSRKSETFPNTNFKFHTFPGPGIKFLKFQNFSKTLKICAKFAKCCL